MIIGENKDDDLKVLEKFVRRPQLTGYVTNMWFGGLKNRYPYDFILYAKKYNKTSLGYQALLETAIKKVNSLYEKLNNYLINPPKTKEQKDELNKITDVLEKLLNKQSAEN